MTNKRKKTSFNLSEDLLEQFKIMAIRKKTTQTELLEKYIKQGIDLEKKSLKNDIPDELFANKDTYNPNPDNLKAMIGIMDGDESFDPVKAIKEIHNKKVA